MVSIYISEERALLSFFSFFDSYLGRGGRGVIEERLQPLLFLRGDGRPIETRMIFTTSTGGGITSDV